MEKIKVVIVDNAIDIINYFSGILSNEMDMEVIGTAISGAESVPLILAKKPDVVLMDIQMETMTAGIDAIASIHEIDDTIKFIVLTIHQEDDLLFKAYTAGAMDYLLKTSSISQIVTSIRNTHQNNLLLRPEIAEKILSEFVRLQNMQSNLIDTLNIVNKLTNSEFEILRLVCEGYTYKKIAQLRYVTEGTVKLQANKLLKKFDKKSMKEIASLVKQTKILDMYNK